MLHGVGDARFSNHLERVITDSASTRSTGALPKLHCYPPYTIGVISLANGAGKYDVGENNNNSERGGDVGTRFFSKTRESGAWELSWILLSAAAVLTTSAVVSQRMTIHPCRFCDELIVSVFERRSAPHDQSRVAGSAFRSFTLVFFS